LRALRLHHRVAQGDLTIAADHDAAFAAYADDGGGVKDSMGTPQTVDVA
jgi:hypothetical protein